MFFTKSSYFKEKFSKLALTQESIKEIEFEQCQFIDCSFIDCHIEQSHFYNTKFFNSSLSAVLPIDSRFIDVSFSNSKVIGIDWTRSQSIQNLSFINSQINYSNFRQLEIPNSIIVSCEAKEVDFNETNLSSSDLHDTDFDQSIFHKTNLTKCNFLGAKNYFIDPRVNFIKKAQFSLPEALTLLQSFDISIN